MNEEMRKAFEDWIISNNKNIDVPNFIMKNDNGAYIDPQTSDLWVSWQASREAMKPIKLPKETDTSTCKSIEKEILHDGINYGIQQCKEAIKQSGYKVEE